MSLQQVLSALRPSWRLVPDYGSDPAPHGFVEISNELCEFLLFGSTNLTINAAMSATVEYTHIHDMWSRQALPDVVVGAHCDPTEPIGSLTTGICQQQYETLHYEEHSAGSITAGASLEQGRSQICMAWPCSAGTLSAFQAVVAITGGGSVSSSYSSTHTEGGSNCEGCPCTHTVCEGVPITNCGFPPWSNITPDSHSDSGSGSAQSGGGPMEFTRRGSSTYVRWSFMLKVSGTLISGDGVSMTVNCNTDPSLLPSSGGSGSVTVTTPHGSFSMPTKKSFEKPTFTPVSGSDPGECSIDGGTATNDTYSGDLITEGAGLTIDIIES